MSMISMVELDDGEVNNISFHAGGGCRIAFEYVYVYHPIEEDLFELWSYSAELALNDLVETQIFEEVREHDYIADDHLIGAGGEKLRWEQLIGGFPVSEIRFVLPSGCRISIHCRHAELRLGSKIKRHEDWRVST